MSSDIVFPTGKLSPELLESLIQRCTTPDPRLVTGPRVGEDVAVIDMGSQYMVVKTDPITFATDEIGWYAVHVNANDVATSGATPLWMLATVLLPEGRTTGALVETIFDQLHAACGQVGVTLVGGHTEVSWGLDRPIVVGVMIGEVSKERLITTGGAQQGDCVLLVQGIPIEATAIIAHERAAELHDKGYDEAYLARARNYLHDPGISVVAAARIAADREGVHAMHDPTEGGVATGLHELAYASRTGLRLHADRVPVLPEGGELCAEYGLDVLGVIASGSLLVAVDPEHCEALLARYADEGIVCSRIADLLDPSEGCTMVRGGVVSPLPRFDKDEITRIF